jgi:hypothetical protein
MGAYAHERGLAAPHIIPANIKINAIYNTFRMKLIKSGSSPV